MSRRSRPKLARLRWCFTLVWPKWRVAPRSTSFLTTSGRRRHFSGLTWASLCLSIIWTPTPHVPWSLHLVLTVVMSPLRKSPSGDSVSRGWYHCSLALFGVLMLKGEKRSSRPSGICMGYLFSFRLCFVAFELLVTLIILVWRLCYLILWLCLRWRLSMLYCLLSYLIILASIFVY
jgi:hypothetical protein